MCSTDVLGRARNGVVVSVEGKGRKVTIRRVVDRSNRRLDLFAGSQDVVLGYKRYIDSHCSIERSDGGRNYRETEK